MYCTRLPFVENRAQFGVSSELSGDWLVKGGETRERENTTNGQKERLLPYTHSVAQSEERSSFGAPSIMYGSDCFRIKSGQVPTTFPGSGEHITFPLPHLSKNGDYAWTETALWHPHNVDKSDYAAKSQWHRPYLSTLEVWQMGRSANGPYPLKDVSSSRPFR